MEENKAEGKSCCGGSPCGTGKACSFTCSPCVIMWGIVLVVMVVMYFVR